MNIKLYYNNVEIYKDVSICYLLHETNAEKSADSLTIRFNDVSGMWSDWSPEIGDQLRLKCDSDDSGIMYLHNISAENGIFTLRCLSMPPSEKVKKTRSWEGLSFKRLVSQIASEQKLSYKLYGVDDQIYKYLSQDNETNLEFLSRLCKYEGCAFTIYNKSIVVYSERYIESKEGEKLTVGKNGVFDYHKNPVEYTACTVRSGRIVGKYGSGNSYNASVPATSKGEAVRFAKGILRSINKNSLNGRITKSLHTQYSAGTVLRLQNEKASIWNQKVFLTKVRHDILMNRSDIYFRGILEGY